MICHWPTEILVTARAYSREDIQGYRGYSNHYESFKLVLDWNYWGYKMKLQICWSAWIKNISCKSWQNHPKSMVWPIFLNPSAILNVCKILNLIISRNDQALVIAQLSSSRLVLVKSNLDCLNIIMTPTTPSYLDKYIWVTSRPPRKLKLGILALFNQMMSTN